MRHLINKPTTLKYILTRILLRTSNSGNTYGYSLEDKYARNEILYFARAATFSKIMSNGQMWERGRPRINYITQIKGKMMLTHILEMPSPMFTEY